MAVITINGLEFNVPDGWRLTARPNGEIVMEPPTSPPTIERTTAAAGVNGSRPALVNANGTLLTDKLPWRRPSDYDKHSAMMECVWDVLKVGGWYTQGALANRLGIHTEQGKQTEVPEYRQLNNVLIKLMRLELVIVHPAPHRRRCYAEAEWARTHLDVMDIIKA